MIGVFLSTLPSCVFAQGKSVTPKTVAPVSYSKEIQPIFRTACTGCHNPESAAGGLNLASFVGFQKGGKGGLISERAKIGESRLVKYLTGSTKPQMPPGGALKQPDIDRIRKWVEEGAKSDVLPGAESSPNAPNPKSTPSKLKTTPLPSAKTTAFKLNRSAPVTSLLFLADGKTLAVGTYREVQFWNPETKLIVSQWQGHADAVRSLALSKDGKLIAAAGGVSGAAGEVRIWEVISGRETLVLGDHSDTINGVAFSPDGTKLATASADKTLKLWDLTKPQKPLATGKEHSDALWGVAWSPDGKYIASCSADRSVKIWDALTLKRLYTLSGHEDVVYSVEFSPDSKFLLSASADKTARIWSVGADGGTQTGVLGGHSHSVISATYASNGTLIATASADKTVRLWKPDAALVKTLSDAKDWAYAVRFSKDQKSLSAGTWSGEVLIWSLPDGKLLDVQSTFAKAIR